MIQRKFHLATVEPTIDTLPNTAISHANDLVFDWYPFEIPKGACKIHAITVTVPGADAAATAGKDIDLVFAKSINGVAPTSLGNKDDAITVIKAAACRRNIIGRHFLDSTNLENADYMIGYNIWSYSGKASNDRNDVEVILQGDPAYNSTEGYQTIWVAGVATEAGYVPAATNVLLDGAILTGAAGAQTLDVANDADADDIFQVGDEVLACANDGSSVQKIGTITTLTADAITVNAKDINGTTVWSSGALADDDEICFRRPLTLNIGLEY